MAAKQPQDPGPEEKTQPELPQSLRKAPRGLTPEQSKDLQTAEGFWTAMNLEELKAWLQKRTGEMEAISSGIKAAAAAELGKKKGETPAEFSLENFKIFLLGEIRNGRLKEALQLIIANEKNIIIARTVGLLRKKYFADAGRFLKQFLRRPDKRIMDERQAQIQEEVDNGILGPFNGHPGVTLDWYCDFTLPMLIGERHFDEAVKVCGKLNNMFVPKLKEVEEEKTIVEPERPHAEELRRQELEARIKKSLPKDSEAMLAAFPELDLLLEEFERDTAAHRNDSILMEALQGYFQAAVEKLIEAKKFVIAESAAVKAEEMLLTIIDELGDLGLHLYMPVNDPKRLHLMADSEANGNYRKVDLRKLTAEDIVIDEQNFETEEPVTAVKGRPEDTEIIVPKMYYWTSRVVRLSPRGAEKGIEELGEAA